MEARADAFLRADAFFSSRSAFLSREWQLGATSCRSNTGSWPTTGSPHNTALTGQTQRQRAGRGTAGQAEAQSRAASGSPACLQGKWAGSERLVFALGNSSKPVRLPHARTHAHDVDFSTGLPPHLSMKGCRPRLQCSTGAGGPRCEAWQSTTRPGCLQGGQQQRCMAYTSAEPRLRVQRQASELA